LGLAFFILGILGKGFRLAAEGYFSLVKVLNDVPSFFYVGGSLRVNMNEKIIILYIDHQTIKYWLCFFQRLPLNFRYDDFISKGKEVYKFLSIAHYTDFCRLVL
jgi:hypothetical protein